MAHIDYLNYICDICKSELNLKTMPKRTVPVKPHRRSTPSPVPRKNPNKPKPGPKTVPVRPHRRTPPSN